MSTGSPNGATPIWPKYTCTLCNIEVQTGIPDSSAEVFDVDGHLCARSCIEEICTLAEGFAISNNVQPLMDSPLWPQHGKTWSLGGVIQGFICPLCKTTEATIHFLVPSPNKGSYYHPGCLRKILTGPTPLTPTEVMETLEAFLASPFIAKEVK
jgi:hypothetical protein